MSQEVQIISMKPQLAVEVVKLHIKGFMRTIFQAWRVDFITAIDDVIKAEI
jgi:hypothetical protein